MRNLKDQIEKEIEFMEKKERYISRALQNLPEGKLKVNHSSSGSSRFYLLKHDSTGNYVEKYLSKRKQQELINGLALKQYMLRLKQCVEEELMALHYFYDCYLPEDKYDAYDKLDNDRKGLIEPIFEPVSYLQEKLREIDKEAPADPHNENLKYTTDRGELVRSKSELVIANYLYQNRDRYDYEYEKPLFLPKANRYVRPDFTILNLKSGRTYYYEHAGMMDNYDYANGFIKKINSYITDGHMPGTDLLISYESAALPLNVRNMKALIANCAI